MIRRVQVHLNGETREVPRGTTLAGLLQAASAPAAGVAVEVNQVLVRRAEWDARPLEPGDRVEVVHLVGGG